MAVICREKKLLFLLNPRTGSSALGDHLIKEFGGEWLPKERYFNEKLKKHIDFKHNTVAQLLEFNLITKEELDNFIVFTSVSNPYYNLLTLYNKYKYRYDEWRQEGRHFLQSDRIAKEIEFCKKHSINLWIFKNYWRSSIKSLLRLKVFSLNNGYVSENTEILKKESLQKDFSLLLNKYDIKGNPIIPVINKTEKNGESLASFSFLSKLLIFLTYYKDFKNYNYKF